MLTALGHGIDAHTLWDNGFLYDNSTTHFPVLCARTSCSSTRATVSGDSPHIGRLPLNSSCLAEGQYLYQQDPLHNRRGRCAP
jgi:hypothetical protein